MVFLSVAFLVVVFLATGSLDAGDEEFAPGDRRPPPFTVPFAMPLSGFAAIDIHDGQSGKLVRRLIAETPREQGAVQEPWDLRDNDGQIVPPGEYTFRGLAVPPLERIYELTLYNAGQPPWSAPAPAGKGGGMWLADHVAPSSVAAKGDMMWLGSFVVESGHCMIATDLDGNKSWGTTSFSNGFRGPSRIAVDERCAYGLTNSLIYRVDPQRGFKGRSIFNITSTAECPWNVGGTEPGSIRTVQSSFHVPRKAISPRRYIAPRWSQPPSSQMIRPYPFPSTRPGTTMSQNFVMPSGRSIRRAST